MSTQQSTVKWFDAKKGYGFIDHPEDGNDVFVHYSQIESEQDFKTLRTGQPVEFELNDGPKGLHALSVVPLGDEVSSDGEVSVAATDGTLSQGVSPGAREFEVDPAPMPAPSSETAPSSAPPPRFNAGPPPA